MAHALGLLRRALARLARLEALAAEHGATAVRYVTVPDDCIFAGKAIPSASARPGPSTSARWSSPTVLDRAEYLERYVRAPDVRWHAQALEDVEVHRFGDTAIVTASVHDRATFGTQELDAWFRSTFVYAKTASGWQCVAGHNTSDAQRSAPRGSM